MKIAIIGGGWVGCHLAYKLKGSHDITLFEKNNLLFKETSYNNQNRLHLGFHYSRNHKTRQMCKDTFNQFMDEYGFLTKEVPNNLYCIPKTKSFIDYVTYLEIFRDFDKEVTDIKYNDVEGCINTGERHIDFSKASDFFNKELKDMIVNRNITKTELNRLSKEYDLVINSTNNHIKHSSRNDSFYELTISLLYKKIKDTNFDSLTLVDGEFFSIYPYKDDVYTLTDVEHTPIRKFNGINKLNDFIKTINQDLIDKKISRMEKKVKHYLPEFDSHYKYSSYFLSTKSKIVSMSDERYPIIDKKNNIINCFTGKIQGIYIIEKYIQNEINNR
jgi:hypothetical protein